MEDIWVDTSDQICVYCVDCCFTIIIYQMYKLWTQICRKRWCLKNVDIFLNYFFYWKLHWFILLGEEINGIHTETVNFSVRCFLKVSCYKALPLVYCVQVEGSWNTRTMCTVGWKINWCWHICPRERLRKI